MVFILSIHGEGLIFISVTPGVMCIGNILVGPPELIPDYADGPDKYWYRVLLEMAPTVVLAIVNS